MTVYNILCVKILVYDTNLATTWGHDWSCVQTSKFFKQLTLTKPKITIKVIKKIIMCPRSKLQNEVFGGFLWVWYDMMNINGLHWVESYCRDQMFLALSSNWEEDRPLMSLHKDLSQSIFIFSWSVVHCITKVNPYKAPC